MYTRGPPETTSVYVFTVDLHTADKQVQDGGKGNSDQSLNALFTPFYEGTSTGLGLRVSHEQCLHAGIIALIRMIMSVLLRGQLLKLMFKTLTKLTCFHIRNGSTNCMIPTSSPAMYQS